MLALQFTIEEQLADAGNADAQDLRGLIGRQHALDRSNVLLDVAGRRVGQTAEDAGRSPDLEATAGLAPDLDHDAGPVSRSSRRRTRANRSPTQWRR